MTEDSRKDIAGNFRSRISTESTKDTPSVTSHKRSFLGTFKSAVDKVMLKRKIGSEFNLYHNDKPKEFTTIFNLPGPKQMGVAILQNVEDENENILKDLPPMTDAEVIEFTASELVGRLLNSKYFRYSILTFILMNSILIAVETDKTLEREYYDIFKILDQSIMSIFICEILLKWYHGFTKFWKQGWDILDFLIVVSLIVGPHVIPSGGGGRGVIRILRVLRAFRSLRSINSLPGLQVVVQTILQSVPDMTNIVLLLVIIMLVFSVIGITLFREVVPTRFGDLSSAMFSLFVCVTQDGWMEIFQSFQEQGLTYYYGGGMFLVIFISIGAFIFANLVVAVVVTNLECAVKDVKKEEEQQVKELKLKGKLDNEDDDVDVDILKCDDIPSRIFEKQTPLLVPDFSGMDVRNIEDYFLIIGAMEENLRAYQKLKTELIQFFDEVCELNQSAMAEGIFEADVDEMAFKSAALSYQKAVQSGDIMSGIINLESSQLIDTRCSNTMHDIVVDSAALKTRLDTMGKHRRRSSVAGESRHT